VAQTVSTEADGLSQAEAAAFPLGSIPQHRLSRKVDDPCT